MDKELRSPEAFTEPRAVLVLVCVRTLLEITNKDVRYPALQFFYGWRFTPSSISLFDEIEAEEDTKKVRGSAKNN